MSADEAGSPKPPERTSQAGPRLRVPQISPWFLLAVVVVGFIGLRVAFHAYKIPSGAMIPSLEVGDHVFAYRLAYGDRVPERGDMIVFELEEAGAGPFVKRVVGLPGDRLEFEDGHPSVDGKPLERCLVGKVELSSGAGEDPVPATLYVEFAGSQAYWTSYVEGYGGTHQGPYVVPEGQVWVVGDNRHNSHDSRAWNGGEGAGVPLSAIEGRVSMVWLPLRRNQLVGHTPVESDRLDDAQRVNLARCLSARSGK